MDRKQYDEYLEFTHKFLDTINIENYITKDARVRESMRQIEDCDFRLYKAFCEEAEKNGTLPDIVKEEDPEFCEIFNVMDETDFVDYVENRFEKECMSYEQEIITLRWN